ncbi:hypothetical protein AMTRI_Chr05g67790 [Amborella trichopoda]|uniref:SGNH hydrolase-type esterase domain-containing protein n=1 Tax=Amborella trichopoda TaxID=13333 RepID=U5D4D9_AMBTC|nr:GDSL esterase/lipase At1g29660 [Amborella trichopoda]ERN15218.1 hypothetical protein AMTR_s00056p00187630 [Amborella trichopoda]|eukprot:XP_006853751.1 GDSL esterase/lipase At1g29660 [Amborella trichopoda]
MPCNSMKTHVPKALLLRIFSVLLFLCFREGESRRVKAMFVFGSSIVDNGNNNFIRNSTARADYFPYGIDFPGGASGRFSNGLNAADVLGQLVKIPRLLPAFADPRSKGNVTLRGVNYASGGSGILDETGSIAGGVTPLNQQIKNFETVTLPQLESRFGSAKLRHVLRKSIFVIGSGGNDYLLNYLQQPPSQRQNLSNFTNLVIQRLSEQLKKLHGLGARKFVLISIQPLGCAPVVISLAGSKSCVEGPNQVALLFNNRLRSLVDQLRPAMSGSNLVYVNAYGIIRDIIDNPIPGGFKVTGEPCCALSMETRGFLCEKGIKPCIARNTYVYFDGLHQTQAVNMRIALRAYTSSSRDDVYPINVQQLSRL